MLLNILYSVHYYSLSCRTIIFSLSVFRSKTESELNLIELKIIQVIYSSLQIFYASNGIQITT